jgi:hypothetical protein
MTINQQIGEERLEQILKNININHSQVCLVEWFMRDDVRSWCEQNKIEASYSGSLYSLYDVWEISNEEHMIWF